MAEDDEQCYLGDAEDQAAINASSAFAVLDLVEYFERRIHGRAFDGSKLFLYHVVRRTWCRGNVIGIDGAGADLRTTLKMLTRIGAPPEEYWPYESERISEPPPSFVFSLARPMSDLRYFRLDPPYVGGAMIWRNVKSFLAAGFPVAFGFSVPSSMTWDADIPYRPALDSVCGGQAALAVGYEEGRFGPGQDAVLFRTSWGGQWGTNGNGWLPAAYIIHGLARDFWTVISERWDAGDPQLTKPAVMSQE